MNAEQLATPELQELRAQISGEAIEGHMLPEKEVAGDSNTKKSENAI